jgi:hypothetical protein
MIYKFRVNDDETIHAYDTHEKYDLRDEYEKESLCCKIGEYINSWFLEQQWPVKVIVLKEDETVYFTADVDVWLEPTFEAYIDEVNEND